MGKELSYLNNLASLCTNMKINNFEWIKNVKNEATFNGLHTLNELISHQEKKSNMITNP